MTENNNQKNSCIFLGNIIKAIFGNKDGILTLLDEKNTLLLAFKSMLYKFA